MKKQLILIASGIVAFFIIFLVTDGLAYLTNYQTIILKFDSSTWLYSPGDQVGISILAQPNSSLMIKVFSPRSQVVWEEKIDSQNGVVEYSFVLSPTLLQGTYTVIVFDYSIGSFTNDNLIQMQYHEKVTVQKITVI